MKSVEGYDAKYSNISIDDCADFCKTTANCYGFGYDVTNKICYPANQVIFGKPFNSIYSDRYRESDFVCNKVQPVVEPDMTPAFHTRRTNAMFTCGQPLGNPLGNHLGNPLGKHEAISPRPTMYLHDHGRLNKIFEGQNPDFITYIDEYSVYLYIWPNNIYEGDQLDRLGKDRDRYFRPIPTERHPDILQLQKVEKVP
jgi:hypothetical protein